MPFLKSKFVYWHAIHEQLTAMVAEISQTAWLLLEGNWQY
jgi:hypothetical protein